MKRPTDAFRLLAPGNVRGMLAFWLCRLLSAWLVAAPLVATLSASGVRQYPAGDALLFEPGAVLLVEAVRLELPELLAALRMGLWIALSLGVVLLLPLSALWVALAAPPALRWGAWWGRAVDHVPAFALLGGLSLAVKAGLVLVALLLAAALSGLRLRVSEPSADLAALSLVLATLLGAGIVDLVFDLARAARIRHGLSVLASLRAALEACRRRPLPPLFAFSTAACISTAGVLLTAVLVGLLHVERGPVRFALAALLHLTASFGLVVARAFWLCRALSCVPPTTADTLEDSAELRDPTPDRAA